VFKKWQREPRKLKTSCGMAEAMPSQNLFLKHAVSILSNEQGLDGVGQGSEARAGKFRGLFGAGLSHASGKNRNAARMGTRNRPAATSGRNPGLKAVRIRAFSGS